MTLLDTIKSLLGLAESRRASDSRRERSDDSGDRAETVEPATDSEAAVKGVGENTTDEPAGGGDAAGSTESMVDTDAEGGAESGEVTGPGTGADVDSEETAESVPDEDEQSAESAAAGGDAAASTGSLTEEHSSDVATEPGEAAGPEREDDDFEFDHDEEGATDESEADATATDSDGVGVDDAAEESAAAGGDAAGSTGSITEETNESISATEDAEAVGPTGEEPSGDTDDMAVDALKGIGPSYSERLGDADVQTVADLAAADPAALAEETDIPASRIERWAERAKARRQ